MKTSKRKEKQRLLIALIPQKEIVDNLNKIRKMAGVKKKKKSAPHITIVDNSFSSIKKVDEELKKIAKLPRPFNAHVKGIDTFIVKKTTGIERYKHKNSLMYRIKNSSQLNNLRREILKRLDYLKTPASLNQWKKENPSLSEKALKNIKKYGTPFGLKEWKFHTTIGLIPKKKQKEILNKIRPLDIRRTMIINSLGLFIRKNGWKLYKKYKFKN